MKKTGYIAGIARGHNAGVCLLKDGEIVFAIEEERLSRYKYDGGPLASMIKILDYTDKIDYLAISHTQDADEPLNDYVRQDVYTALARKLRLIEDPETQVVKYHAQHHRSHAALAFYRSGFEKASAIIVDGAGTFVERPDGQTMFEVESIYDCTYPANYTEIYKHFGGNGPWRTEHYNRDGKNGPEVMINDKAGIVKSYEAVTRFCGFDSIEAGKTMGLFPYGEPNKAPKIYTNAFGGNKDLFTCTYPNGAWVDESEFPEIRDRTYDPSDIVNSITDPDNEDEKNRVQELLRKSDREDVTLLPSRRNMAYNVQIESQQLVLDLILKSIERTGNKNIVISGGYALNCVANYFFLKHLPEGVKIYVEPVSNDAGTAMGAAFYHYYLTSQDNKLRTKDENLFLGPVQTITEDIIRETAKKYNGKITTGVDYKQVIDTIRNRNIVALYQERGESGPRALGNRSLMYDPTDPDGKDFVNLVKKREYFRPFAATVLQDDVHDWFDLRGMEDSPSMMYAVNCQPGVKEKIPAVIHVDDTCRIQTVTKEQNEHWYNLIKEFKNQTGVPALFNTSFNLGGEPLVETIDDALHTLYNSGINYIYFPAVKMLVEIEHNDRA